MAGPQPTTTDIYTRFNLPPPPKPTIFSSRPNSAFFEPHAQYNSEGAARLPDFQSVDEVSDFLYRIVAFPRPQASVNLLPFLAAYLILLEIGIPFLIAHKIRKRSWWLFRFSPRRQGHVLIPNVHNVWTLCVSVYGWILIGLALSMFVHYRSHTPLPHRGLILSLLWVPLCFAASYQTWAILYAEVGSGGTDGTMGRSSNQPGQHRGVQRDTGGGGTGDRGIRLNVTSGRSQETSRSSRPTSGSGWASAAASLLLFGADSTYGTTSAGSRRTCWRVPLVALGSMVDSVRAGYHWWRMGGCPAWILNAFNLSVPLIASSLCVGPGIIADRYYEAGRRGWHQWQADYAPHVANGHGLVTTSDHLSRQMLVDAQEVWKNQLLGSFYTTISFLTWMAALTVIGGGQIFAAWRLIFKLHQHLRNNPETSFLPRLPWRVSLVQWARGLFGGKEHRRRRPARGKMHWRWNCALHRRRANVHHDGSQSAGALLAVHPAFATHSDSLTGQAPEFRYVVDPMPQNPPLATIRAPERRSDGNTSRPLERWQAMFSPDAIAASLVAPPLSHTSSTLPLGPSVHWAKEDDSIHSSTNSAEEHGTAGLAPLRLVVPDMRRPELTGQALRGDREWERGWERQRDVGIEVVRPSRDRLCTVIEEDEEQASRAFFPPVRTSQVPARIPQRRAEKVLTYFILQTLTVTLGALSFAGNIIFVCRNTFPSMEAGHPERMDGPAWMSLTIVCLILSTTTAISVGHSFFEASFAVLVHHGLRRQMGTGGGNDAVGGENLAAAALSGDGEDGPGLGERVHSPYAQVNSNHGG